NTTTLPLGRTGSLNAFTGRSLFDWLFAALVVAGGVYAFSRYGAAMDVYGKGILIGTLPACVALGWYWSSLRTLMIVVAVAVLLAIGLYGQAREIGRAAGGE